MATLLSAIETSARKYLLETTANYWSSAELIDIMSKGCYDLWGAVLDLHQEHFLTIDITNVSLAASTSTLTGTPADTFRVHNIEPRDTTTSGAGPYVLFIPRDYNSPEFINARSLDNVDPSQPQVVYYCVINAGSPVAAPAVQIAPKLTSALPLRFTYVPGLGTLTSASTNPIPGESDQALVAYTVAFALSKDRDDRSPDPNWLKVYSTEKANLLTRLTPRQDQEPDVVQGLFESYW